MNKFKPFVIGLLAVVGALLSISAAQAALSVTENATWTVATVVGISVGAGGCGNPCAFGPVIAGVPTGLQTTNIAIQSNDANGFQLATSANSATYTESGCASPNATRTVPASSVGLTPTAITGGTGGAGTPASAFNLSTTSANLFTAAPTATGAAMVEGLGVIVTAPSTTLPNTGTCSYLENWTVTATAN